MVGNINRLTAASVQTTHLKRLLHDHFVLCSGKYKRKSKIWNTPVINVIANASDNLKWELGHFTQHTSKSIRDDWWSGRQIEMSTDTLATEDDTRQQHAAAALWRTWIINKRKMQPLTARVWVVQRLSRSPHARKDKDPSARLGVNRLNRKLSAFTAPRDRPGSTLVAGAGAPPSNGSIGSNCYTASDEHWKPWSSSVRPSDDWHAADATEWRKNESTVWKFCPSYYAHNVVALTSL